MHVHPERRMAIMNEVHDITYVLIWRNNIMMRSMYSAVSGLKAHQTRMDVIGNNIANVNTVAFKSQSMTFSEVFYQTTQTASGPNAESGKGGTNAKQIGLGSSVGSISTAISTEGASERTDNAFDLKIGGSAFFIVNSAGNTFLQEQVTLRLMNQVLLLHQQVLMLWDGR